MVSISKWIKSRLILAHDLLKLEDQLANALSFFVGVILASGGIPQLSFQLGLGFIAILCSLLGINLVNQVADIEIDRINKPHRPLPSGKITMRSAILLTIVLYSLAIASAALSSIPILILTAFYLFLGAAYSLRPLRLKEKFVLNNVTISIGYNFLNFLIGWAIFRPLPQAPFVLLLVLFVYDLIAINSKDYFDVEGDRRHGARTLPVVLGKEAALGLDGTAHLVFQAFFMTLAVIGFFPYYILIMSVFMLFSLSLIFYDVAKNQDFMRFYYASFGLHVLLRVLIIVLFFWGFIKV